jgi:hypothetical protein
LNDRNQAVIHVEEFASSNRYALFYDHSQRYAVRLDTLYDQVEPAVALRNSLVTGLKLRTIVGSATRVTDDQGRGTTTFAFDPVHHQLTRMGLFDATHTSTLGTQTSVIFGQTDAGIVAGTSTQYFREAIIGESAWAYDPATQSNTQIGLLNDDYFSVSGRHQTRIDGLLNSQLFYGQTTRFRPNSEDPLVDVPWVYDPETQETIPLVFSTRSTDGYSKTEIYWSDNSTGLLGRYRRFSPAGDDLGLFPFYWDTEHGLVDLVNLPAAALPTDAWNELTFATHSTTGGVIAGRGFAGPLDWRYELPFVLVPQAEPGDFNRDGVLAVDDVNHLSRRIFAADQATHLDINIDGKVSLQDLRAWVIDLRGTYFGDVNLDLQFESGDLVQVFQIGLYERAIAGEASWATGDWNADGLFNSGDMVLAFIEGGYGQGPRALRAVPEPTAIGWCTACFLLVVQVGRRCRRRATTVGMLLAGGLLLPFHARTAWGQASFELLGPL